MLSAFVKKCPIYICLKCTSNKHTLLWFCDSSNDTQDDENILFIGKHTLERGLHLASCLHLVYGILTDVCKELSTFQRSVDNPNGDTPLN